MEGKRIKVGAVLSTGRLMFSETTSCAVQAFSALGIPLTIQTGIFWERELQKVLTQHMEQEYDYVYTLDYDTVFTADHVKELARIIVHCPKIDALCAVQFRRGRDQIMALEFEADKPGPQKGDYAMDATQIASGHFGLTILDMAKLKTMPKPWFQGRAGPTGEYGKGHCDPDVAFWEKWAQCKNTLYQANEVRIGHLQLMATWPDRDFNPIHQYTKDYRENGPPKETLKRELAHGNA